ncbi:MAG TPA: M28 family peptidase, partial [Bryobacteraceae bacterium]|nr:M28 family peptidase [Bryobacteraceae bacterium]
MTKFFAVVVFGSVSVFGATRLEPLPAPEQAAIDRISADALRGDLSFLASDALEGRGTPSRGLNVAAEFIASEFRRAGLEPVSKDGSYFQVAKFAELTPKMDDFRLALKAGGQELELASSDVRVRALKAIDLKDAGVVDLPSTGGLPAGIEGKIVAGESRRYGSEASMKALQARHPALILLVGRRRGASEGKSYLADADSGDAPVIRIFNGDAASAVTEQRTITVSVHVSAPASKPALLENVAGVLRGSDRALSDQYVIVSAHYDHLGTSAGQVYNGAHDNGSGTASVIEVASALATLHPRPKRSILFLAFFGEEEGLLGAYFYTRHPLVPLKSTVADINFEQMGRTDDQDGKKV